MKVKYIALSICVCFIFLISSCVSLGEPLQKEIESFSTLYSSSNIYNSSFMFFLAVNDQRVRDTVYKRSKEIFIKNGLSSYSIIELFNPSIIYTQEQRDIIYEDSNISYIIGAEVKPLEFKQYNSYEYYISYACTIEIYDIHSQQLIYKFTSYINRKTNSEEMVVTLNELYDNLIQSFLIVYKKENNI